MAICASCHAREPSVPGKQHSVQALSSDYSQHMTALPSSCKHRDCATTFCHCARTRMLPPQRPQCTKPLHYLLKTYVVVHVASTSCTAFTVESQIPDPKTDWFCHRAGIAMSRVLQSSRLIAAYIASNVPLVRHKDFGNVATTDMATSEMKIYESTVSDIPLSRM